MFIRFKEGKVSQLQGLRVVRPYLLLDCGERVGEFGDFSDVLHR
jgi:hypothetical protein